MAQPPRFEDTVPAVPKFEDTVPVETPAVPTFEDTKPVAFEDTKPVEPEAESEVVKDPELRTRAEKALKERDSGFFSRILPDSVKDAASDFKDSLVFGLVDEASALGTATGAKVMEALGVATEEEKKDFWEVYEDSLDLEEAVRKLRRDRSTIGTTVGNIAGFVGGVGGQLARQIGGSTAGRVAAGTALGGAEGALDVGTRLTLDTKLEDETVENIVLNAAFGGVGEAAVQGAKALKKAADSRKAKRTAANLLEEFGDDLVAESRRALDAGKVEVPELTKSQLDNKILTDFKRYTGFEDLDTLKDRVGGDAFDEQFERFKDAKLQGFLIKNLNDKRSVNDRIAPISAMGKIVDRLIDGQYVMSNIDRLYGTEAMPSMVKVSEGLNRASFDIQTFSDAGKEASRLTKAAKLSPEKMYAILDGKVPARTPEEKEAAKFWWDTFEDARQTANEAAKNTGLVKRGELISKLKGKYVPRQRVSTDQYVARVVGKIDEYAKSVGKADWKDLDDADYRKLYTSVTKGDKLAQDVVGGLSLQKNIKDPTELKEASESLINPTKVNGRLSNEASASLRRQDSIPDYLLEKDPAKLLLAWSDNTFKHVYGAKPIDDLRLVAEQVREVSPFHAEYIENVVLDTLGRRNDTFSAQAADRVLAYKTKMQKAAELTDSPKKAALYRSAAALPDVTQAMARNLYPAFLGLNPDGVFRNLTGPFAKTAQDVGGAYGNAAVAEATLRAGKSLKDIADIQNAKPSSAVRKLRDYGLMPADFSFENLEVIHKGIDAGGKGRRAFELITNKVPMYFYTKADVANRVVTLHTAEKVTRDALAGNQNALTYIRKLQPGYRKQALRALNSKNEQALERVVASHLNATTQFNYDQVSKAAYARYMGGLFSMFSKWPTAIAGDMIDVVRGSKAGEYTMPEAVRRLGTKYAGPLVATMLAAEMIESAESPRLEEMIGSPTAMKKTAPATSPADLLSLDQNPLIPPAVETTMDLIQGATKLADTDRDLDERSKTITDAITNFTPGGVYVKFINQTLPRIIENEKE